MQPEPVYIRDDYRGSGKLDGKVALITGGDSGIGRAVAVHFAREGASVAIVYLNEDTDATETKRLVEAEGVACLLQRGDVARPGFCRATVDAVVECFGRLDVLVNNAAQQFPQDDPLDISDEQLKHTFETNLFPVFLLRTRGAAAPEARARCDHQHGVDHRVPRQPAPDRLLVDEGCDCRAHALARKSAGRRRRARERRRAGSDLDAADPRVVRC